MTINSSNTDDCTRGTSTENELLSVNTAGNESLLIDDNENHNFHEEKIVNEKPIVKQNDKNNLNRSPLVLVSLVGSCANKQPSNNDSFRPEKSTINDNNSHLIEHSTNDIPAQRPPRANKQRIAKLAGQKSRESPPNSINRNNNKPVDSNNNKVLKFNQQNIQQSHCRSSVPKTVLARHQSCPNRIENSNLINPTPTTRRLKEKITKLDMVPAQDYHSPINSILPDLDNCEVKNGHTGDDCPNEINENQIVNNSDGAKLSPSAKKNYSQQLSDWKSILTHELNVYQNIQNIKRQHLHESSHSGRILNGDKPKKSHNSRSKAVKLTQNTPTTPTPELIDSLDDSWERVASTTDATPNSTPPTTAETTTAVTTSAESGRSASAGTTRATGTSVRTKKYSSEKFPTGRMSVGGIQLTNGKRRSASLKKNIKIITPYEKVIHLLETDKTWQKEIAFGRRIGLYRFRGDIGNGNFSQVKIAIHTLTKEKVAVKILDKSRLDLKTKKMLTREIRTMETLHHPNLIRIFEVIESLSKHFIVMELAPVGELFQVISTNGRFAESEAKFYFSQIISAIDHMHQHNLIHRDIKAENVFFSDPHTVKVGDFGFSTRIHSKDELLSTFCGSPPYAAPELFRDESYRGPYVDYWALGVLLYFIVTGMMPFRAQNIVSLKKIILECRYDIPVYVSVECCQLIAGFLQPEPVKRYNLEQARSTRWLHNQSNTKSLPKYDLKSSYTKLIKQKTASRTMLNNGAANNNENGVINDNSNDNNLSSKQQILMRHTVYGDKHYDNGNTKQLAINDSDNYGLLNRDENETFHQLMLLGIDEKVLNDHFDKGSHSHIVGTFRIIMHRVLNTSMERLKRSAAAAAVIEQDKDQHSPILRSQTSMGNAAPMDRFWAHYVRKAHQAKKQQCPPPSAPKSAKLVNGISKHNNEQTLTLASASSNDSGKSLTHGSVSHKPPARLKKMFSTTNSRKSTPSPTTPVPPTITTPVLTKLSVTNESPKESPVIAKKNETTKTSKLVEAISSANALGTEISELTIQQQPVHLQVSVTTPVEEVELKKTIKIMEENSPDPKTLSANDTVQADTNGSIGGRLTRSFRTIKQLLTESNICGNNVASQVVQSQSIGKSSSSSSSSKPHVIHKTTTLQLVPRNVHLHSPGTVSPIGGTPHWIWPNGKQRAKLWRSQTTPDVSLINDGHLCIHHHHCHLHSNHPQLENHHLTTTLPCYCDKRSSKKSFNNNNRCTIV